MMSLCLLILNFPQLYHNAQYIVNVLSKYNQFENAQYELVLRGVAKSVAILQHCDSLFARSIYAYEQPVSLRLTPKKRVAGRHFCEAKKRNLKHS